MDDIATAILWASSGAHSSALKAGKGVQACPSYEAGRYHARAYIDQLIVPKVIQKATRRYPHHVWDRERLGEAFWMVWAIDGFFEPSGMVYRAHHYDDCGIPKLYWDKDWIFPKPPAGPQKHKPTGLDIVSLIIGAVFWGGVLLWLLF